MIDSSSIDRAVRIWCNSPISPDSVESSLVTALGRAPTPEEREEFTSRARAAMAGLARG